MYFKLTLFNIVRKCEKYTNKLHNIGRYNKVKAKRKKKSLLYWIGYSEYKYFNFKTGISMN